MECTPAADDFRSDQTRLQLIRAIAQSMRGAVSERQSCLSARSSISLIHEPTCTCTTTRHTHTHTHTDIRRFAGRAHVSAIREPLQRPSRGAFGHHPPRENLSAGWSPEVRGSEGERMGRVMSWSGGTCIRWRQRQRAQAVERLGRSCEGADASLNRTRNRRRWMGVREAARDNCCAGGEVQSRNGWLRPRTTPITTPLFRVS